MCSDFINVLNFFCSNVGITCRIYIDKIEIFDTYLINSLNPRLTETKEMIIAKLPVLTLMFCPYKLSIQIIQKCNLTFFHIFRIMAPKIKLVKRQAEKIEELTSTIGTIVEQQHKVHHTSSTTEAADEGTYIKNYNLNIFLFFL